MKKPKFHVNQRVYKGKQLGVIVKKSSLKRDGENDWLVDFDGYVSYTKESDLKPA